MANKFALAFLLILATAPSGRAASIGAQTWALLNAADFHPEPNGQTRIWRAGNIHAGGRQYEIWRYRWLEDRKHMPSVVRHENNWLLVVGDARKGRSLLGGYKVDNSPIQVRGSAIEFDYSHADTALLPGVKMPPAWHYRIDPNLRYQIIFGNDGPPSMVTLFDGDQKFVMASHHMGMWRILDHGNFSGSIDRDAGIWRAGEIAAGGKRYDIWGYRWENDPRFWDSAPRQERKIYKVLVFEHDGPDFSYLGSYDRDDVGFHVEGRTVVFDVPRDGRPAGFLSDDRGEGIVFTDHGPPTQARENWRTRKFGR